MTYLGHTNGRKFLTCERYTNCCSTKNKSLGLIIIIDSFVSGNYVLLMCMYIVVRTLLYCTYIVQITLVHLQ